jgi:hypothetical protein
VDPIDETPRPAADHPSAPSGLSPKAQPSAEPRAFGARAGGVAQRDMPLEQLARAFREGRHDAPAPADLLQTAIDRLIAKTLSPQDCAAVADIQRLADEALAVAFSGRLDGAASRFVRANRVLEDGALDSLARGLGESLLWVREAQAEAAAGRFSWADELLEAAFDRDLVAEEAGLDLLLAHRVHLAHTRMRLDQACGRLGEALLLGAGLLQYLERPAEPPCASLRPCWRRGWRDHRAAVDPMLTADLHRRIAEDQLAVLTALEAKDAGAAVAELRRFAPGGPSQIAHWTEFQIAGLEGDEARRNDAARLVLTAGPCPSAPLCSSVADAVLGGT